MDELPKVLYAAGAADVCDDQNWLFTVDSVHGDDHSECIADNICRRWNACAGVPPADLRPGMLAEMIRREAELLSALRRLHYDVQELMNSSQGVYGLHLNGDEAPWGELDSGGQFCSWIGDAMDLAAATLNGEVTAFLDGEAS